MNTQVYLCKSSSILSESVQNDSESIYLLQPCTNCVTFSDPNPAIINKISLFTQWTGDFCGMSSEAGINVNIGKLHVHEPHLQVTCTHLQVTLKHAHSHNSDKYTVPPSTRVPHEDVGHCCMLSFFKDLGWVPTLCRIQ